jgi:membrane-anchored protein YejM (alkaline phosphatase superfamily)
MGSVHFMLLSRASFGEYWKLYRYLITALAINVPLISLILLLNLRSVDFSWLTCIYAVTVFIGCYTFPLLIFISLLFLPLFPLRRTLTGIACAVFSIFVFYLFIDALVYNIFKFHIDLFWLQYAFEDFQGLGMRATSALSIFLALVAVALVQVGIFRLATLVRRQGRIVLVFCVTSFLTLGISQIIHIAAYEKNDSRITSLTPHFPFYYPVTSHKNAVKYGDLLPIGEAETEGMTADYQYSSLSYPLSEIEYGLPAGQRPPNIVFLLVESWRAEMMDEEVSPNIHAFARRSADFRDHFSSGNSTTAGVFGLFYGLYATYWTAVKANSSHIDNPLLIDVLEDGDYEFGIFADSNFDRHKIKDTMFRGIDVHETFDGKTEAERDGDLNRRMIAFMEDRTREDRPFMALAFYKSSHFSYDYPEEFAKFLPSQKMNMLFANNDKDPVLFLNDQRNAVYYLDSLVGDVIESLESLDILKNTIVVITTDHAEEFNDNGENYWGHGSNFTKYQTQVPLIIHFPGREPATIEFRTSHVDIVPTILSEYFGCRESMANYSNGRSLFQEPSGTRPLVIGSYVNHAFLLGDDVFAIFPMFTKKYKLDDITQKAGRPRMELMREVMEEINRFYIHKQDDAAKKYKAPTSLGSR